MDVHYGMEVDDSDEAKRIIGESETISLRYTPTEGRFIVAKRDILAGEIIMECEPYAIGIEERLKRNVCKQCMSASKKKLPLCCNHCQQVFYCSERCKQQSEAVEDHMPLECLVMKSLKFPSRKYSSHEINELRLLVSAISQHRKGKTPPVINLDPNPVPETQNETVNTATSTTTPTTTTTMSDSETPPDNDSENVSSEELESKGDITMDDLEDDMDDTETAEEVPTKIKEEKEEEEEPLAFLVGPELSTDKKRKRLMLNMASFLSKNFQPHFPISTNACYNLLAREMKNVFGVWENSEHSYGLAIYPRASFFNHSCLPNCVRVQNGRNITIRTLYPIQKGRELNICYINWASSNGIRKSEISDLYGFKCGCVRCLHPSRIVDKSLCAIGCKSPRFTCSGLLFPTSPVIINNPPTQTPTPPPSSSSSSTPLPNESNTQPPQIDTNANNNNSHTKKKTRFVEKEGKKDSLSMQCSMCGWQTDSHDLVEWYLNVSNLQPK
eukprot:TRINITY_DN792_c0_g1_i1.p1 TRINITY_DN792_c0_g1~~TRINITY_DN792_c0_g1_i1.p1  ORF type:complete len:498 (-),score=90.37 TRINITY_DN792_c0_g1_i1:29-1522(-)